MTYAQFPYAVLSQLGTNLDGLSSGLTNSQRGAEDCNGLGNDGQSKIQDAIGDFRDTWKSSVQKLVEEIGEWGGLSKAIGDMVAQFDAQTAAALLPPGSGKGTPAP